MPSHTPTDPDPHTPAPDPDPDRAPAPDPTRGTVRIHYRRPPDRVQIFVQELILDEPSVKVTLARSIEMKDPLRIDGRVVLEHGSDAVWFTFPGVWHDIGLFHRADGTFSGTYANILTPCVFRPNGRWDTTDLCLDLWIPGPPSAKRVDIQLLDEDELEWAVRKGWIDPATAGRAGEEADRLIKEARAGRWPPPVVDEWPLSRARR